MISTGSLMKSKAPIVGIPMEGTTPICVDGKRLRTWGKGVTIDRVEVLDDAKWLGDCVLRGSSPRLVITGRVIKVTGRASGMKCSATFAVLPQKRAIAELLEWSRKERERLQKKTMSGVLSTTEKRAIRRAKFEDDGESLIPVMCLVGTKKEEKRGIPVVIPEFPELRFALVHWVNANTTVTELVTGMQVGNGTTGENAILDARTKAAKLSADKRALIIRKVESEEANAFDRAMAEAVRLTI
jgi:hypothetical protein